VCNPEDIVQTVPTAIAFGAVSDNGIGLIIKQVLLFLSEGVGCHVKECSSHRGVEQQFIIPNGDDPLSTT